MFPIYRFMEKVIKEYVESEKGKNTYFMVMSDHGFSFYDGGYNHYNLPGYNAGSRGDILNAWPESKVRET